MIHLQNITIQGFGSIQEPISYQLDKPGINIILGKNGVGKSTIFNALTWCLWGKLLKPDSSWKPWKPQKELPTNVTVNFGNGPHDVEISRGEKYLHLTIDREYQENLRNRTDVQNAIDRILGISFNLAKNSIIFGQKLTRLLSQKGEVQKQLFDEAFDAGFINIARERIQLDYNEAKQEYDSLKSRYETLAFQFKTEKAAMIQIRDFFETNQQNILAEYTRSKMGLQKKLKDMLKDKSEYDDIRKLEEETALKLEDLKKKLEKYPGIQKKHFKLDMQMVALNDECKAYVQELLDLKKAMASKNPTCPACGQDVSPDRFKKVKEAQALKFKELSEKINQNTDQLKTASAEFAEVNSSLLKYKKLEELRKDTSRSLDEILKIGYDNVNYSPGYAKNIKEQIFELEKKILSEETKKPPLEIYRANLKKLKAEALEIKPRYQEKAKRVFRLNWLLKDPFSNSGLKAYIFNSMLSQVNDRLSLYARFTGFRLNLHIDLESARKNFECMIYRGDQMIVYPELSGGEQQLADVMLAFAIHDIMSAEGRFNILIMDEIFESLDDDNIETVLDMLLQKGQNLSLHLITHIKKLSTIKNSQVVTLFKKKDGITRLA